MLQSGCLTEEVTVRELVGLACDLHPKGHPVDRVLTGAAAWLYRKDTRKG